MNLRLLVGLFLILLAVGLYVVGLWILTRRQHQKELQENEARLQRLAKEDAARRIKVISATEYRERFLERRH